MTKRHRPPAISALALAVVVVATAGCASSESARMDDAYRGEPASASVPGAMSFDGDAIAGVFAERAGGGGAPSTPTAKNEPQAPQEAPPPGAPALTATDAAIAPSKRLMIYRAAYGLLVANVDESVQKFMAQAVAAGGYLEARNGDQVSVRVPVARFQPIVDALPAMGTITAQNLAAMDVTKQCTDTTIRMENAEASRRRLLELLKQATKMEDILSIEREIRRLSEEIETMKGELRYLADQVAFSTISVQFQANAPPPVAWPAQQRSRFEWVNAIGLERVLYDF